MIRRLRAGDTMNGAQITGGRTETMNDHGNVEADAVASDAGSAVDVGMTGPFARGGRPRRKTSLIETANGLP